MYLKKHKKKLLTKKNSAKKKRHNTASPPDVLWLVLPLSHSPSVARSPPREWSAAPSEDYETSVFLGF